MKIFHTKKLIFAAFLPGILLGFLYVKLIAKNCAAKIGIFGGPFISDYGAAQLARRDFLHYLLPLRLIPFAVLLGLMFTDMRKSVCILAQIWTGFTFAALLGASALRLGISGILLCAAGLFPQFLMYIPSYIVVIWYGYTFPANRWNAQKTLFVVITMLFVILLECCVNPPFMKLVFKVFKLI